MALTQPIPHNAPNSRDVEASKVLAVHNKSTASRLVPLRAVPHANVPGESAGTKVAGAASISGGAR